MPAVSIPFQNASTSPGGMGFVRRSIRGLREKIWIASHPMYLPAFGAFANPPAMAPWPPGRMARPGAPGGRGAGGRGGVGDRLLPLHRVAVLEGEPLGVDAVRQDRRVPPLRDRPEDVGAEDETVVHRDRLVPRDPHAVAILRACRGLRGLA